MSAWWRCGRMKRLGVGLAAVELREHLVGRVPAPRAVALHLPVAPQLLGRVEVDADVEHVAQLRGCGSASSPSVTTKRSGHEVVGRAERAVDVLVDAAS